MLGYDVSWAAFNIVEVMSSSKFTYKVQFEYKSLKCRSQNVPPEHFLDKTGNRLFFYFAVMDRYELNVDCTM